MKKRLQLALAGFLLLVFSSVQANPDTIFLHTQTDVDNFQATYAITDNLPGGIIIRTSGLPAITHLNGLSSIQTIGTFLHIENNAVLSNVEGLSNITEVGGDLTILNNPMLADCRGISQLVDSIDDGAPGPSFDSTPDVGGSIFLSDNIASCSTIGEILLGYRVVTTQQEVNDLELGADNTIDGNLIIGPSTNITNLDNLMALEKVVGNLIIINNEGLEDFGQGLVNLDSVGCVVYIGCNDNLCNLENLGIATLLYVSSDLIVIDNPMLEDCCGLLPLFTMGTIVGGAIMFGNNPLGNCNRNGADISSSTCPFIPVPTLSQWGFFLFTCIIFTLAVVGLYNLKKVNLL